MQAGPHPALESAGKPFVTPRFMQWHKREYGRAALAGQCVSNQALCLTLSVPCVQCLKMREAVFPGTLGEKEYPLGAQEDIKPAEIGFFSIRAVCTGIRGKTLFSKTQTVDEMLRQGWYPPWRRSGKEAFSFVFAIRKTFKQGKIKGVLTILCRNQTLQVLQANLTDQTLKERRQSGAVFGVQGIELGKEGGGCFVLS